jgi:hypothetical protein
MPYERYEAGAGYLDAFEAVTQAGSLAAQRTRPSLERSGV